MIDFVDFDFTVKFEKFFYIFCWDYIFMFSGGTIYLKKKKIINCSKMPIQTMFFRYDFEVKFNFQDIIKL